MTRKKSLHADERDSPHVPAARHRFATQLSTVDPSHLVFVKEMGATRSMARTHGRVPAVERVVASAPSGCKSLTLITGLRPSGVVAPLVFPGATDQLAFETYVEEVLAPTLQRGDVVVWDNLRAHQSVAARAAVEARGATVQPLPPYRPDLKPIEEPSSKAQGFLRAAAARTTDTLIDAFAIALDLVTPGDIRGWFHNRAYEAIQ